MLGTAKGASASLAYDLSGDAKDIKWSGSSCSLEFTFDPEIWCVLTAPFLVTSLDLVLRSRT